MRWGYNKYSVPQKQTYFQAMERRKSHELSQIEEIVWDVYSSGKSFIIFNRDITTKSRRQIMIRITIKTNLGVMVAELDDEKAPVTVDNFMRYVNDGFYNGTIFHRVIKSFMVQGGGYDEELNHKKTSEAIVNEAGNGLSNLRGTLSMARTGVIDSATSQFFINLRDNFFLDHKDETAQGFGYAVFGKLVEGMDVLDKVGDVETGRYFTMNDVPLENVVIEEVCEVE